MLSSILDALLGQVPFVPVITVLDALPAVLILWYAGWTVTEAARVRDGAISPNMVLWPSKKGVKGTHEEFVARYRRRLYCHGKELRRPWCPQPGVRHSGGPRGRVWRVRAAALGVAPPGLGCRGAQVPRHPGLAAASASTRL